MNLKESIRKILREETEIPLFVRRRFTLEDLEWLVNDVKEMIDDGESLDTAIYDGVREFIKSRKFSDIDEFGLEAAYWESYLKYERPLVRYVKNKLNIRESILRETREDKLKSFLFQRFDKVFDELNLKVDYEENNYVYGKWFDKDGKDIFHRNDWGVIWIINCEPYKELYIYSKLVGLNEEEFEKILVEYFNNKYLDQFLQKPFKNVSDENHCLED